jgi:hypothetical protein
MRSKFIIVSYSTIPRDTHVTHIRGWRDTPNATQYNENIGFKNNISMNDLQTAKLILNTKNKTIEKNSFGQIVSYDQALEYLKKHYPKYFVDA